MSKKTGLSEAIIINAHGEIGLPNGVIIQPREYVQLAHVAERLSADGKVEALDLMLEHPDKAVGYVRQVELGELIRKP